MMTSSSEQNIHINLSIESKTSTLPVAGKSKLNCRIDVVNVVLELQGLKRQIAIILKL